MTEKIIAWAIPFLCGSLVAAAGGYMAFMRAVKNGMQSLLRAEIIRQHEKWTSRRYCPIYAREALTKCYNSYHALGGNDVATALYKEIIQLPTDEH